MKVLLFLVIASFLPATAGADTDITVGAAARSYPAAAAVYGDLGQGTLLWGKKEDKFYGYMGSVLEFVISPVTYSTQLQLDIAPVNFIVLSGGGSTTQSNGTFSGINCDSINCEGLIARGYWSAELKFKQGEIAATSKFVQTFERYASQGPWFDSSSSLVFQNQFATYDSWISRLIVHPDQPLLYGLISQTGWKSDQSGVAQDSQYLFARYVWEKWKFTVAAGRLNSGEYLPGFSCFGQGEYKF